MAFTVKKLGVLVLAAALFCGISGYADAKGPKGNGAPRYMEQLTPEQQNQARAIFEEGKNARQVLAADIAAKKAELAEVMKSASPDAARIEALSKELGQLRGKEMLVRMETTEKIKKAGLPELKKPVRDGQKPEARKGGKEEFANKRIAKLPEAKQAEARKIYADYQAATAQTRESLKANRADLEKALEAGDAQAVERLASEMGELQGKMRVAKAEMRQNLAKADIPADTFDRDGKKGGKRGMHGKHGKDGKRGKKMD